MNATSSYKKHISNARPYVGGSTRSELATDRRVYKLSSNENMLGPSPMAIEAIQKSLSQIHEYDHQDDSQLREVIAESFGDLLSEEQIITANSGMELLDLICRGLLEPGDNCILSTPAFLAYKGFADVAGAAVTDVPLKQPSYSIDVENILRAVDDRTKLLFLASPNNPTGTIITKAEMDFLVAFLPPHVTVVYDEVYHHYVETPGYARAADYIEKGFPLIGIHSFSKAYGLAGIRLGYAIASEELAGYLRKLRRPFMINTLSMQAGIAALKDHGHIERTLDLVTEEKKWLYKQLRNFGMEFTPSHANYIFFRAPYHPKQFAKDMLDGGVMVRTADVFGAPDHIRVSIGTREANNAFINNLKILL